MLFVWDELAVNGLRTWICGRYDSSRRLFRAKERGRFFACPADTGRTIFAVITPTLILLHIHTGHLRLLSAPGQVWMHLRAGRQHPN
ncbi:hypothetical protein CPB86DRAFT_62557 [Serendipita vermifera]|nr:hypothetical protein CPB86DRAFT_62557 [Serendipita vermifera]